MQNSRELCSCRQLYRKKHECQFGHQTSSSQSFACPGQVLVYFFLIKSVEELPGLLTIGQVRMKSYLPENLLDDQTALFTSPVMMIAIIIIVPHSFRVILMIRSTKGLFLELYKISSITSTIWMKIWSSTLRRVLFKLNTDGLICLSQHTDSLSNIQMIQLV